MSTCRCLNEFSHAYGCVSVLNTQMPVYPGCPLASASMFSNTQITYCVSWVSTCRCQKLPDHADTCFPLAGARMCYCMQVSWDPIYLHGFVEPRMCLNMQVTVYPDTHLNVPEYAKSCKPNRFLCVHIHVPECTDLQVSVYIGCPLAGARMCVQMQGTLYSECPHACVRIRW